MQRTIFGAALLVVLSAFGTANAQEPVNLDRPASDPNISAHTPSMYSQSWLYLQEQRRHDDPKLAVRRKAEFKAEQRAMRLATLKWYGLSNARPTASANPFMGTYSPTWTGNGGLPYLWRMPAAPLVIHDSGYDVYR